MAKYLLMGDIHLSDRPPSSCTDSYLDDLFALLERALAVGREAGADAVIWAGDVFHHKTPGRTTHATVKRLIELAAASGIPHYVVPGNHDMLNDRLGSLGESQPLGVVIASGAVHMLNGWMGPDYRPGAEGRPDPVYGVPWLARFDEATVGQALAGYRDAPDGHGHRLVVTHAPLYPPGRENPFEHFPAAAWAAAMGNRGSAYYGHVHDPAGVYTVDGVTFCNPGALSRGSLHEYNLARTPSVATWDSETGQFTIHELPAKPADEVFKLAEAAERKQAKVSADAFLASIRETRVHTASVEAVWEQVRGMRLEPDLESLLRDLLEAP